MWIKLDDGFATHPKILRAGIRGAMLQIRALCYASQHHTDGFLPEAVVPLLTMDLDIDSDGEIRTKEDWPLLMITHGLWERVDNLGHNLGYRIHNYLRFNISKDRYQVMREKLSQGGRKGMQARWKKEKSSHNPGYGGSYEEVNNPPITSKSTATDLNSLSSSPNLQSKKYSQKRVNGKIPIPDDWMPNESHQKLASARGLELNLEAVHFKGKAQEQGWETKDWNLKFKNWMLQEVKFRQARRSS